MNLLKAPSQQLQNSSGEEAKTATATILVNLTRI